MDFKTESTGTLEALLDYMEAMPALRVLLVHNLSEDSFGTWDLCEIELPALRHLELHGRPATGGRIIRTSLPSVTSLVIPWVPLKNLASASRQYLVGVGGLISYQHMGKMDLSC